MTTRRSINLRRASQLAGRIGRVAVGGAKGHSFKVFASSKRQWKELQ